ncbi:hypothetical protein AN690_0224560 [Citrobacter freundii]|nr:hypothetical protein AN690_0224560 [Citrobacter freundii]
MKAYKKEPFSILRLHVLMKIPVLLFRSHIHYGQTYDTHTFHWPALMHTSLIWSLIIQKQLSLHSG